MRRCLAFGVAVAALWLAPSSLGAIFTVNSTADPGTGVCDVAECTLREAITAANGAAGADVIQFSIAPGGLQTITLGSGLPAIFEQVTIDGSTQTGWTGAPLVELTLPVTGQIVLEVANPSAGTVIKELVVNGTSNWGIRVGGGSGTVLEGNYVGTNATGTAASGSFSFAPVGVIGGTGHTVGGATAAAGNVVAGLVTVTGASTSGTTVQNNIVGLDATGSTQLGASGGVNVTSAPSTQILDNAVAGQGITVSTVSGTVIRRNRVGTNAAGTADAAPGGTGIRVLDSPSTIVGGDLLTEGNLVAGASASAGISVQGGASSGTTIRGNRIGTDLAGTSGIANALGIDIVGATGVVVGGPGAGQGNLVSGNTGFGVQVRAGASATIQGNLVGTDLAGTGSIPNGSDGIRVDGSDGVAFASVGGTGAGEGNTVANNTGAGISVTSSAAAPAVPIRGNTTADNGGLGIDLAPSGVTPNDPGDPDTGANGLQNFPLVTTAVGGFGGSVSGTLNSLPSTPYAIDVFASGTCDASGNGEGATYLGTVSTATNASGDATWTLSPVVGLAGGQAVTATATGPGGTSELSPCATASAGSIAFTVTKTADTADGVCDADCSLREAINAANAVGPGPDPAIAFSIGSGPQTIQPTSALPPIARAMTIDASTQPGFLGSPLIELDGTLAGAGVDGLEVVASGAVIQSVAINRFGGDGIQFTGPGSVSGSHIGLSTLGDVDLGNTGNGIRVAAAGVVVGEPSGNVISGNGGAGIEVEATGDNARIVDNRIGTNAAGSAALANFQGVQITGADGVVVGEPSNGNLIAGNTPAGIRINPGTTGTVIEANIIGTNAAGTAALGQANGIGIVGASSGTLIQGNLVSGHSNVGITVNAAFDTSVRGNVIGLDLTGTTPIAGSNIGMWITNGADLTTVGGTTPGARNVISGHSSSDGVRIDNATNVVVEGNYVGVTADGLGQAANNTGVQVGAAATVRIGGPGPGAGNLIVGPPGIRLDNADSGVEILGNTIGLNAAGDALGGYGVIVTNTPGARIGSPGAPNVLSGLGEGVVISGALSTGTVVEANRIGTDASGSQPRPNANGIRITGGASGSDVTGNTIAFNTDVGVMAEDSAGGGNRITQNTIHSNGDLGIELGSSDGVTPNDPLDLDTGPNDLQNFPVLAAAELGAGFTRITGSLGSKASRAYRIDFYASPTCDASGNGEGQSWIGWAVFSTNASGTATIDTGAGITATPALGEVVTATATDQVTGDTSEFAACTTVVPLSGPPPDATIAVAPTAGSAEAGAGRVPLAGVPPAATVGAQAGATRSTPLDQIPLDQIPLDQIPLDQIPLDQIGFDEVSDLLGSVQLASIPLLRPGGWEALLDGTVYDETPLQGVTLRDVYALAPAPAGLATITLGELDLTGSPLGRIAAVAAALGTTPLAQLGLPGPGTTLQNWCDELTPLFCGGPATLAGKSLLSVALEGAPLDQIPLDQIPLDQIPLDQIPLDQIPLDQIPLDQIPLDQIALALVPLDQIPVASPLDQIPLDQIPLDQIPLLFSCTPTCPSGGVVGDHRAEIIPGTTIGDLLLALEAAALAGLDYGDWLESVPNPEDFTLTDLLYVPLRTPSAKSVSWEDLDLEAAEVQRYAAGGSTVGFQAAFTLSPGSGPASVAVAVTLPDGFLYEPGSAVLKQLSPAGPDTPLPAPAVAGQVLTWTPVVTIGTDYRIDFTARPGLRLGPLEASATATPAGGSTASSAPAVIDVGETYPGSSLAAPQGVSDDSLYVSYLTSADDVDAYAFPVPAVAGSRVVIRLGHLPADYDLVVYGPTRSSPRQSAGALDGFPLPDEGISPTNLTDVLGPEALADLQIDPTRPLAGVSAQRGTEEDAVTILSDGGGGDYTIQVVGFNGAASPEPYTLRVEVTPPPDAPIAVSRVVAGTAGSLPAPPPPGTNTVFVVNRRQLEGLYGAGDAATVLSAITANQAAIAALGFPSVVLEVDGDAAVRSAYDAWNADTGNAELANAVVREINRVVDDLRAARPELRNLVLVGGDPVIPFGRLVDFTKVANEATHASAFEQDTDLFGLLRTGHMLSDDVYAATEPLPFLSRQLFLPDLAVGRLLESPQEIADALARFVSFGGELDPSTALTTGYDFLTDGAQRVEAALAGRVGAGSSTALVSDAWGRDDLVGAFLPAGSGPAITSLNGHADHFRLQPAESVVGGLFSSADLTGSATSLQNGLVFSMGCHAGLSVADVSVAVDNLDWAQAHAQKGATFLGNTTFGYGDTVEVAYSEELNALFAERIAAGGTVGDALQAAKQLYAGSRGVFGVYDEKVSAAFTLYGLPMWSVAAPAAAAAAPAAPAAVQAVGGEDTIAAASLPGGAVGTDPVTGLSVQSFDVTPSFTARTTSRGRYYLGDDGAQVSHLRPIVPKALVDLDGTQAHGALITGLASADEAAFDPVFSMPTVDSSASEPERPYGDVVFPSRIQAVRTVELPEGTSQQLVLVTGQFFDDGVADGAGVGVHRTFTRAAGVVYRSASADRVAPSFSLTQAVGVGTTAGFTIEVSDTAPGTVERVVVGVRSGASGTWSFVDLAQDGGDPALWTGGAPISAAQFEYFVQAVDNAGNVAVTSNKGLYYAGLPDPPAPTGDLETEVTSAQPPVAGWFKGTATVTVDAPDGVDVEASVDGAPYQPVPAAGVPVTGDGLHVVRVRGSNGGEATHYIPIDATAPVISITSPTPGQQIPLNAVVPAAYSCTDAGSGLPGGCAGTVANGAPLDTATAGTKTFTVGPVTDAAGNTTPARTVTYAVVLRSILFSSARTGGGDVYSIRADGTGATRLTTHGALDDEPALSPDGTRIAFASARGGAGLDIYVMNADGTNVQRLTTAPGDDTTPSWSPDGAKIAFSSARDGGQNVEIYVMGSDGTAQTRLTQAPGRDETPAWSPNGARIAFMSDRKGGPNVWVMNADGTGQVQLTTVKEQEAHPAWSPNGQKIAFASKRRGKTKYEVFVMNADGTGVTGLTSSSRNDVQPAWSDDGASIVFSSNRVASSNYELYVMAANGSGQTRITTSGGFDQAPDW